MRVDLFIALPLGGRVRVLRVSLLPLRRGQTAEARAAYEVIDEVGAAT